MTDATTLLLTDSDVRRLLSMPACIDIMQDALERVTRGESLLPLRTVLRLDGTPNAFAAMPAVHGNGSSAALGAKIITVFPGNASTPFESHIGVVLLFDAEHGLLRAIIDASSITSIRTAAVSGLATRLLARTDASRLAILGAGELAMPHVDAMMAARPIRHVGLWSRGRARVDALAERIRHVHGLDVAACDSAEDAVRDADIICTVTSSRTPVLEGHWIAPGTHINAVGASLAVARELDADAVRRSSLFVDRRESALAEAGDFLLARSEGVVDDSHIRGEIGQLSLGQIAGRTHDDEITLFKSLGLAVEDVAVAQYLHLRAQEASAGVRVQLGGLRH